MALTTTRLKARIDRLLAQWQGELSPFMSVVNTPLVDPARIDDGPVYDGRTPNKPDFLKADDAGWEPLE